MGKWECELVGNIYILVYHLQKTTFVVPGVDVAVLEGAGLGTFNESVTFVTISF